MNGEKIPGRRQFLRKAMALVIGAMALFTPVAAGLAVLFDPLRRKSKAAGFIRIATLDALPLDGSPRRFEVIADKFDAWSKFPASAIGSVYLQRKGDTVVAFNTHCPHFGCPVDAVPGGFHCPCHNSAFDANGNVVQPSPSPRGLDRLEVDQKALKAGIVQVRYQNFVAGQKEMIPRS